MKFNWGTGILIFLIIFLMAAAGFIFFAMRQDVNLVHQDYYEKGVDHSTQMKVQARSVVYHDSIHTSQQETFLVIALNESLAERIDSGNVILFRPSDRNLDLDMPLEISGSSIIIPKSSLTSGRYILKLHWYTGGLKYEVDKTVEIR